MDTFGFTKKKLTALRSETQHRHMMNWLSKFYQKLTSNRVTPSYLDLFTPHYNTILAWTGMRPFVRPDSDTTQLWLEAISDRIHYHRTGTGAAVRDYDLLETVHAQDLSCDVPGPADPAGFHYHVALDGLRSLFNVGSIFRTCDAAGVNSIILGNIPGKEHPGVRKTAMGAQRWVAQEQTDDLAGTLLEKKRHGFTIIGVETMKDALPFYDMPWKNKTVLVFGNEEYGLSSHVMAACDEFVYIPMFGKKNSINVANAVSVICFQMAGAFCAKIKKSVP